MDKNEGKLEPAKQRRIDKKKTREIYACVFGLKVNHDDGFFMHANGEKKMPRLFPCGKQTVLHFETFFFRG